jgi:hypothetical protein
MDFPAQNVADRNRLRPCLWRERNCLTVDQAEKLGFKYEIKYLKCTSRKLLGNEKFDSGLLKK